MKPLTAQSVVTSLLPHSGHSAGRQKALSLTPAGLFIWGGPALPPCSVFPHTHPSHWPSGRGGWGGNSRIALPALHETLKGQPSDPHSGSAQGQREVGLFSPPPSLWASPLPPLSFVESNLRIKPGPGASWAWSQLRQDRVFQCLEPKGKY